MKSRIRSQMVAVAWLFAAGNSVAQPSTAEKALASQLFDEAAQTVKAGKLAEACPKFAESHRLDPQLGTLLHLADCHEKVGRTASAWTLFREAEALALQKQDKRAALAQSRTAKLEAMLSKVEILAPQDSPAGLEIQQDGSTIGRAAWEASIPCDPGTHVFAASADGFEPWSQTVNILPGPVVMRLEIPRLTAKPVATDAPPRLPETAPANVAPLAQLRPVPTIESTKASIQARVLRNAPHEGDGSFLRMTAIAVGTAGVGALAVAGFFGIKMSSSLSERDRVNACSSTERGCSATDAVHIGQLTADARDANRVANISLVAGGVLVAAGATMLIVPSSPTQKASRRLDVGTWADSRGALLTVGGFW